MTDIYSDLDFPDAAEDRPYTFIDMVSTIDGKTLSGGRNESVADLGSKLDHFLLRRIESMANAILLGAGTLRANPPSWSPKTQIRVVVSSSGVLPYDAPFFEKGAFVAVPTSGRIDPPQNVSLLKSGQDRVDVGTLMRQIRDLGVSRLLVLGGSELNAQLLENDLVDELFLTIAPKIKLGRGVPTYAGGNPLDRDHLKAFSLLESNVVEDEVFLRYRRVIA